MRGAVKPPSDRHQPDENQPCKLLGTCDTCKTWYIIDLVASVMIALPDGAESSGRAVRSAPEPPLFFKRGHRSS